MLNFVMEQFRKTLLSVRCPVFKSLLRLFLYDLELDAYPMSPNYPLSNGLEKRLAELSVSHDAIDSVLSTGWNYFLLLTTTWSDKAFIASAFSSPIFV
jgi:hypothetical protein